MLAVTMAVSINWSIADIAIALGCDDVAQYYNPASGLMGANLKAKLHEIVAGHKQLSYAQVVFSTQCVFNRSSSFSVPVFPLFHDNCLHNIQLAHQKSLEH